VDNGTNWTAIRAELPLNTSIYALTVSGGILFAGATGNGGMFRLSDNGMTWVPVNIGLTNQYVYALAVIGNTLFAGTYGGGVFKANISGLSSVTSFTNTSVEGLTVRSAKPNPANDATTLEYEIVSGGRLSFTVSDMSGRTQITLDMGYVGAGIHDVCVPTADLASGSYIVALRCGSALGTKQILVVR
jgi:hypothetical protein